MVYGTYNELVTGAFSKHNGGGHIVPVWSSHHPPVLWTGAYLKHESAVSGTDTIINGNDSGS